jgi:hypothetical protein
MEKRRLGGEGRQKLDKEEVNLTILQSYILAKYVYTLCIGSPLSSRIGGSFHSYSLIFHFSFFISLSFLVNFSGKANLFCRKPCRETDYLLTLLPDTIHNKESINQNKLSYETLLLQALISVLLSGGKH